MEKKDFILFYFLFYFYFFIKKKLMHLLEIFRHDQGTDYLSKLLWQLPCPQRKYRFSILQMIYIIMCAVHSSK